ncbi:MAG: 50S ribosomal protein L21 [Leptospiraceae bacterium]|nr:50S ribosomal protein L21 [Leptospiraceae bacterium]MCB1200695.1 50S ribosomal protein L21 [Leptospiraceae bacterium]
MLALIEVAGKQYRVAKDTVFYADLTGSEPGKEIEIASVLLVQNGTDVKVGQPYVETAKVKAMVLSEEKGEKINAFVYKRKKSYHRRWGHRQRYHKLQVTSISA